MVNASQTIIAYTFHSSLISHIILIINAHAVEKERFIQARIAKTGQISRKIPDRTDVINGRDGLILHWLNKIKTDRCQRL